MQTFADKDDTWDAPVARKVDGGIVALRGFAYQFDQTLLAVLDRPEEDVVVEHIEDVNGANWCIQTKQYSNKYAPSVLSDAIESLWNIHLKDPNRSLRLHCHFKDKGPGTSETYNVDKLPDTWRKRLKTNNAAATDAQAKAFLDRLEVHYTNNLEEQFESLVSRIQGDFKKKSQDDAVATHAVLRAHLLEMATRRNANERKINLAHLKAVDKDLRMIVFEHCHAEFVGEERYLRLVSAKLFPPKLNRDALERAFVIDVGTYDDLGDTQSLAIAIANRFFHRHKTGPKGRPPVICIRGLSDSQYQDVLHKIYDALLQQTFPAEQTTDLPLVDGHVFFGSSFRLEYLKTAGEKNLTRLRVIPPDQLASKPVIDWLSTMAHVYHLHTESSGTRSPLIDKAKRVYARNVSSLATMLSKP